MSFETSVGARRFVPVLAGALVAVLAGCDSSGSGTQGAGGRSQLPEGALTGGAINTASGGASGNNGATTGKTDGSASGGNGGTAGAGGAGGVGGAGPRDSGIVDSGTRDGGKGTFVGVSVLQHHNSPSRDGVYIDPAFTKARAPSLHRDMNFKATLVGNVFAQLLFVDGGGAGKDRLFAVTESDNVYSIDAVMGAVVWHKNVGMPAPRAVLPCGNIDPLGITGTPIIDIASRTIFFDAVNAAPLSDGGADVKHFAYGLSIDDGSVRPGWPVDISAKVLSQGIAFNSLIQDQRGALAIWNGVLYIPYGGHQGDCRRYHGWVVGIPLSNPQSPKGWATPATRGGAWGPSGIASDDTGIFMATGNTNGAATWMGGEAVIHFTDGPAFDGKTKNYFAPSNWLTLDSKDLDLGGTGPVLVSLPGSRPSKVIVALGKNGVAYLLNPANLGGIGTGDGVNGEGLFSGQLTNGKFITAASAYTTPTATYVVARGAGVSCPAGTNLIAMKVVPGAPPSLTLGWCANQRGQGSPIVTTPDGKTDAVVWGLGADFTPVRITAFDGDTGAILLNGSNANDAISNVRHFIAPIVAKGRIYVAGDDAAYAFELGN